jgi:hypothetical protein
MKHILLLSIAMIFAAPAWAAEGASATAEKSAAAGAPAEAKEAHKKSHKHHAHKQVKASENMQVRPVAASVDAQAAQVAAKTVPAPRVLAAPAPKALSSTLTCSTGCGPQLCGGIEVCAKNKTICGTPCP